MLLLNTAHCALEYHRWALRSVPRPDGIRYARRMRTPITAPVLHVQGQADPTVLPSSARGSGAFVTGRYEYTEIPSAGHFPHEERPEDFHNTLLTWLATL
jgi:pimeloyl-ACP methyl ester carboxylesterase